jgi:hypothetical protein
VRRSVVRNCCQNFPSDHVKKNVMHCCCSADGVRIGPCTVLWGNVKDRGLLEDSTHVQFYHIITWGHSA